MPPALHVSRVSPRHPAIRRIIEQTVGPGWHGRNVHVYEVDSSWQSWILGDPAGGGGRPIGDRPDDPQAFYAGADGRYGNRLDRSHYGATLTMPDAGDDCIVTKEYGKNGAITIYVPPLDQTVLDVALDARMKDRPDILKELGPYAGIGAAIVDARARAFFAVESGKTSKQLDRDIDEFLRTHRRSS